MIQIEESLRFRFKQVVKKGNKTQNSENISIRRFITIQIQIQIQQQIQQQQQQQQQQHI